MEFYSITYDSGRYPEDRYLNTTIYTTEEKAQHELQKEIDKLVKNPEGSEDDCIIITYGEMIEKDDQLVKTGIKKEYNICLHEIEGIHTREVYYLVEKIFDGNHTTETKRPLKFKKPYTGEYPDWSGLAFVYSSDEDNL